MGFRLLVHNRESGEEVEPQVYDYDKDLITMGRHSSNDLQIVHAGSSRQHCKILFEDGNYFIMDPGSANGTMLNGRKISMKRNHLLKDNDLISIESYDIRFKTMSRVAVKGPGENTDEVALRVVREVLGSLQSKTHPFLEVLSGSNKGKVIDFDKDVQQIIVGRSDSCELILNDPLISRRNTKFRKDWSGISVSDMNSKNGTFVNEKKIKEHTLRDVDEIRIGECKLVFRNPKEAFKQEVEKKEPAAPKSSSLEQAAGSTYAESFPSSPSKEESFSHSAPLQKSQPPIYQENHSSHEDADDIPLWKTLGTLDFIIIGIGALVVLVCITILFKIVF